MDEPHEQMSAETREFLGDLTKDDLEIIKRGLPILRAVLGFGVVTKWLAITLGGLLAGAIFLWQSLHTIAGWLWPPPHP